MLLRTLRLLSRALLVVPLVVVGLSSCRSDRLDRLDRLDRSDPSTSSSTTRSDVGGGAQANENQRARISELQTRFSIPSGVARGFERVEHDGAQTPYVRAITEPHLHHATVDLPVRASDPVIIEHDRSHVRVEVVLQGASDQAKLVTADGIALWQRAFRKSATTDFSSHEAADVDVVHRVHREGTEDYVAFATKPVGSAGESLESLDYTVDVSHVAGLRAAMDINTVEFLDEGGAPRLRVNPPYVRGADGATHPATLSVRGCAYDTSMVAPWGRPVTRPGAKTCNLHVSWSSASVKYPAIVDPSWTTTGGMQTARHSHTATLLNTGFVLLAGGTVDGGGGNGVPTATAELFNPAGGGSFAFTGSLNPARSQHVAAALNTGKVLISHGSNGGAVLTNQLYTPGTGLFGSTGSTTVWRSQAAVATLQSGKVLIVGGPGVGDSAEVFDPAGNAGAGSYALTNPLNDARTQHAATTLQNGKVLVTSGAYGASYWLTAELFDPNAGIGTFTRTTGNMSANHRAHSSTLLPSGKVLIAGGVTDVLELFDPGTGTFSTLATAFPVVTTGQSAILLQSNKVLLVGGTGAQGGPTLGNAYLYDPNTNLLPPTGSLTTPRYYHSGTLLPSGKVLVAGGINGNAFVGSGEIFGVLAAGVGCSANDDCVSGVCEDSVCCAGACSGSCKTCTAGTGACVSVTNADDPNSCTGSKTCDATGTCKSKGAQACPNGNGDCANGQCVDGFCCNTPCANACDVCSQALGATVDGTCGPASVGYAGSPACTGNFACNGTAIACALTCADDKDCNATSYCAADGTCKPRKAAAAACSLTAGADCKAASCRVCSTGYCVDGVCCDTGCTSTCQACTAALKQSGTLDGTCGPAKAGTNPHNDPCAIDPPSSCGHDGTCDGSGSCRIFAPPSSSCGVSACIAGNKVAGYLCDGVGLCKENAAGTTCDPYLCKANACPKSCAADGDCISGHYCKQNVCIPLDANGTTCAGGNGIHCLSGICTDGVCCNGTCTGQCAACDVPGALGACTAVNGVPHGSRAACATGDATSPCGAALCDGTTTTSCAGFIGSSQSCRVASCENNIQTLPASCDGHGNCPAVITKPCTPFTCDAATSACKTSCNGDGDCTAGSKCVSNKCVSGAACSDNHTVVDPLGQKTTCDPYICAGGACKTTCGTVEDCTAPNICNAEQRCAAPSSGGGDEGCSIASLKSTSDSNNNNSNTPLILLVVSALAWTTRARRARRSRVPGRF